MNPKLAHLLVCRIRARGESARARSFRRFFKPAVAAFARRQTWFGLHFVSASSPLQDSK